MEENGNRKLEEVVAMLEERVTELEYKCKNNKALWDSQLKINALFIATQSMIDLEYKIKSGDMEKI